MYTIDTGQNQALLNTWVEDFWAFSGKIYAQPGMQAHCLAWQNQYQGHVNGVLFAIWCDVREQTLLTANNLSELNAVIVRSHENDVTAIRQARLAHSDKTSAEYKAALSAELAAEQRQQATIIEWGLTQLNVVTNHSVDDTDVAINKGMRLQQTQLYLQQHIANYIPDSALKNDAIVLTKSIESIAQRALPSV
jgi:uncharacterized protein (TIGR02444 family)